MKQTTAEISDFYKCHRCNIDSSTPDRMCPCPRGGCEAYLYGKKIVTTEILSLSQVPVLKKENDNKK